MKHCNGFERFAAGFVLLIVAAWSLYVAMFVLQLGVRTAAEYWIYDAKTVKLHLLDGQAEDKKIIFLGGSSLWFGIDSGLIEESFGTPTFNLGLHGMYPLDHLMKEVQPMLRADDTVIMPLEYEYYTADTPYNSWYLNQVMVGVPEEFWASSWQEKVSFFISVPPLRVLEGLITEIHSSPDDNIRKRYLGHSPEQVMALVREAWGEKYTPEEVYTFHNIDHRGDAIVAKGSFNSYVYPINVQPVARTYPWEVLASFAQYCASHGVKVYIGWPPVVKGEIAFDTGHVKNDLRVISQRLAELDLPVLGKPADFQYDRRLFADTGYHLNHEGRTVHTKQILERLREKMPQQASVAR